MEIEMTDRDAGINAIIYLQAVVGIDETVEEAAAGWDKMTAAQKKQTMQAYSIMRGDNDES